MKKLLSAWSVPGAVLALACVTLLAARAEDVAPPIVPPGAVPKKLFESKVLTEGVAVAPDQTEMMIWDLESPNHYLESLLVLRNLQQDFGQK